MIDINCDRGESFGAYSFGNDEALLQAVTSINIACGFHAGDADVMQKTVALAQKYQVKIGAHPSYPDLQGFGRRNMDLTPNQIYNLTVYQIGALQAFCKTNSVSLHHVKPHGALYNASAKNREVAKSIAEAIFDVDKNLVLYGLSGSLSIREAEKMGLKTASEVFADRTYQADASLTPRHFPNAVLDRVEDVIAQAKMIIFDKKIRSTDGQLLAIQADTICIHGDNPQAVLFANAIKNIFAT